MSFTFAGDMGELILFSLGCALLYVSIGKLLSAERFVDRLLMSSVAAVAIISYAYWRTLDTLPPLALEPLSIWNHLFYGFEMLAIAYSLGSIVILLRTSDRSGEADREEALLEASGAWPSVDVFICTYNEPIDVLEKSIIGALALDYPHFTVFVCDDTRREEVRDYCGEVGVEYVTRPDNRHAKAGNLNNAFKRVAEDRTPGDFILVLDADFAPQAHLLRRVVGLFHDEKVGVVQTPQFYYNCDPIQNNLGLRNSFVDDQRVFFDRLQPAKDAAGCAFCVGTSFVVRRSVVDEIGGFPHEALSEDLLLTLRLQQQGYATHWLNERLSVGLSAEGLAEYVTQRTRWCLGTIQVGLLWDGPIFGTGFTLTQRLHYMHGLLSWLAKPFIILMLIAPSLFWFFDMPAFEADPLAFMRYGAPALFTFWVWSSWSSGRRTLPILTEVTHALTALPVTLTILGAFINPFGKPFKVTDKGGSRNEVKVHAPMAIAFGALSFASAAAIVKTLAAADAATEASDQDLFNLIWAGIAMVSAALAFVVCFDRPRPHDEEVFTVDLPGRSHSTLNPLALESVRIVGLSAERAEIDDAYHLSPQTDTIEIGEAGWVACVVEPASPNCLILSPTPAQRRTLVKMLFSDAPETVASTAKLFDSLWSAARMALKG